MAGMVRGIRAVVRNLERLDKQISAGARKARMRAAFEIERAAVRIHEPHVKTARLKGSIATQEIGDITQVGSGVKAGSEVEYAAKHEFGTSTTRAYPFLQPAADEVRRRYPRMVIEDVQTEIR